MSEMNANTEDIIAVVDAYAQAVSMRDTAALRGLLALDDPRFREIEDHIPPPFGSATVEDILGWIDAHPDFAYTVRYRDIAAFMLSDTVAYAVATNDWESPDETGSGRATFIMLKDANNVWRIIHGHWSAMPVDD